MIESPDNVSITMRYDHESCYVFILNFNNSPQKLDLTFKYEILTGDFSEQQIGSYGVVVLRKTDKHDFLTI